MTQHRKLLTDYTENGSEEAFRELVSSYIGLVHASATRLTDGDTHRAEDIAQTVFADLARLAPTLSNEVSLGGWLHRRTCHVAATVMRSERRRQNRERQAVEMNALHETPDETLAKIAPVLDEAINELSAADRNAVMLRFFERCDLRTIGETLGSNEDAVQKRISRALEKLRGLLSRRGVVLSVTALTLALGSEVTCAAPAGLAVSVSTTALAATHSSSASALTTLKLLIMTKLKATAITAVSLALVAGVGTTVVIAKRDKDFTAYTAPANPNPQTILSEAQADTAAGRYPQALGRHIWIHENSLKYSPSFVGVRTSFALSAWGELAKKYPPAMERLKRLQDQAEKTVRKQSATLAERGEAFSVIVGINLAFKDDARVSSLFAWLDANSPDVAKKVAQLAERSLIGAKEYKLYGRYVDPDRSYGLIQQIFVRSKEIGKKSPAASMNGQLEKTSAKIFSNQSATLVAVLASINRQQDADRIADKAAKELDDPDFRAQLADARSGIVPQPWP